MIRLGIALAALLAMAVSAHADPIEGVWQTSRDDNGSFGHIQVAPCGDAYCGRLIRSYNSANQQQESENIGVNIIYDVKPWNAGIYLGKVFSPDRNRNYDANLRLSGDRLSVSGCVFGICRDGGTWVRVQ